VPYPAAVHATAGPNTRCRPAYREHSVLGTAGAGRSGMARTDAGPGPAGATGGRVPAAGREAVLRDLVRPVLLENPTDVRPYANRPRRYLDHTH
jgi:hypothetical protein